MNGLWEIHFFILFNEKLQSCGRKANKSKNIKTKSHDLKLVILINFIPK